MTVENFKFRRDGKDQAFKTGDGHINVSVSRTNSMSFQDTTVNEGYGPEEELKVGKEKLSSQELRKTQF